MMKSCEKMADEVLKKVKEYDAKRIKRNIVLRIGVPSACCLAAAFSLGIWQSGIFNGGGSSDPQSLLPLSEEASETGETSEAGGYDFAYETSEPEFWICTEEQSEASEETGDMSQSDGDTSSADLTEDAVPVPYTEETAPSPYTEDSLSEPSASEPNAEPFEEAVPVDEEGYPKMGFVENAHAPLDGYEFDLPLEPKDTDVILALLNAYDIPEPDADIINTQYALDIGIYLEAGYSNVRTYLPAQMGEDIYALQDGTVIYADYIPALGYCVWTENSEGSYIVYFHLMDFTVNEGDIVSKDQTIGHAGMTGTATSCSAAYMRRDTLSHSVMASWKREDGKISFLPSLTETEELSEENTEAAPANTEEKEEVEEKTSTKN